jgi:hypothetical protein
VNALPSVSVRTGELEVDEEELLLQLSESSATDKIRVFMFRAIISV